MEKVSTSEPASEEKDQMTRRRFLRNLRALTIGGVALRVFGSEKEKTTSPATVDFFAEVDYTSLTDIWNYLEQDGKTSIPVDLVRKKFIELPTEQKIAIFNSR